MSDKLDEKKSKEIENLVRATTELKQVIEVQRIKVRASKETIRRLLVEQSRMERKQVFFYFLRGFLGRQGFLVPTFKPTCATCEK